MSASDHDRVEEVLAGYALDALTGADADEAQRLLAEHVPTCLTCRRLLEDYRTLTGDLALAPAPENAPDTLLVSLKRRIAAERAPRRGMPMWVGAAAAVTVLALGGFSAFLSQRVSESDSQLDQARSAVSIFTDPASRIVPMEAEDAGDQATVGWKPGAGCMLVVEDVARPRRNLPYEVWLAIDGVPSLLVGTFLHRRPQTYVEIEQDLSPYDEIWIVESRGDGSTGEPVMRARL